MLNEFASWAKAKYGYDYVMHSHELASSIVIDIETDDVIGRFTVWDDFSSMSEVIDVQTGGFRINERREFSTLEDLEKIFSNFTTFLN